MGSQKIVLLVVGSFLATGILAACGGGAEEENASENASGRDITDAELTMMVVSLAELGERYVGFEGNEISAFKTNDESAEEDFDPEGEAQDLERFGRVKEYVRVFGSPKNQEPLGSEGAILLASGVQLFEEAEGAAGYLKDYLAEMEDGTGTNSQGFTVGRGQSFKVQGIGDEAAGMRAVMAFPQDGGPGAEAYGTWVFFRRGHLLSSLLLVTTEDTDVSATVESLSREADNRIQAILLLAPEGTPAGTPE